MALALFVLSVVLGFQLFRVLFPLAFVYSETAGSPAAGLLVMAVFAAGPLLAWAARRAGGPRVALGLALGGATAARVGVQLARPVPLWLAAVGVGLALAAWALQLPGLRKPRGGDAVALGFVLGSAIDAAARTAWWTWDPAWQDGILPLAVAAAFPVALAWLLPRAPVPAEGVGGGLGPLALGPFLALQVVFLHSPSFVASQAGVSLPVAAGAVLVGNALAAAAVLYRRALSRLDLAALGVAFVLVAAVRHVEGGIVLPWTVAGLALNAVLLSAALAGGGRAGFGRTALGAAGGSVLFVVLAFVYQAAYDLPIPFPNALVPPAAAALLALAALVGGARPRGLPAPRAGWLAALPLALLAVPAAIAAARASEVAPAAGPSFRVVSYNLHNGVTTVGQVDPEAMARVIEAQDPDVVILQEVARGWVTNGMMDLGEWMSARLGMPMRFGPAADRQFGNAILSRLPLDATGSGLLGRFGGTMDRGYVWAAVEVGGERVTVIGTHLAHRERDAPTRLRQIDGLLTAWGGAARTVLAGDMNALPASREVARFLDAGFVSVQDVLGLGELPTSWRDGTRIDYIFATPDLVLSRFARPFSRASDHLPLAVTVSVR